MNCWVNGGNSTELDSWYREYGREFAGESSLFKKITEKDGNSSKDSDIINNKEYKHSFYGKFEDKEVRDWYISHDKNIINIIDKTKNIKEQAIESHSLRNKYRTEARLMMKNREMAEKLNNTRPNINFKDLVKSKIERKNLTEKEAHLDIINTAGKTNKEVNKKFNLE